MPLVSPLGPCSWSARSSPGSHRSDRRKPGPTPTGALADRTVVITTGREQRRAEHVAARGRLRIAGVDDRGRAVAKLTVAVVAPAPTTAVLNRALEPRSGLRGVRF